MNSCNFISKWDLWGYPKIYLGHSDDFKFAIQNNECTEIAGNYGKEIFQRISFGVLSTESCIHNTNLYSLKVFYWDVSSSR